MRRLGQGLAAFWLAALLALAGAALARPAAAEVALPALKARVTDLTATLDATQAAALETRLAAIERERGAQIAILLLPGVAPESIGQFGIRLAEAWKVGRKGVDDGVIIIVAKNERTMRIEVGYGLEGALPDAVAKRIVAEQMAPRFAQGDFAGGLDAAVTTIDGVLAGEPLPPPSGRGGRGAADAVGEGESAGFWLFAAAIGAGLLRTLFGLAGSVIAAALAGWFAFALFGSWLGALAGGLAVFAFSFLRLSPLDILAAGGGRGGRGGGGGFSGGGGGFGGGGASGRW